MNGLIGQNILSQSYIEGECPELCVSAVDYYRGILSPDCKVNLFSAGFQYLSVMDHLLLAFCNARSNNFISDSSLGDEPRFLVDFRSLVFTESIALLVYILYLILDGYSKNEMMRCRFLRQDLAIKG